MAVQGGDVSWPLGENDADSDRGGKAQPGSKSARERVVPVVAQWLTNPTRNHEVSGSVPALAQWVNDPALLGAVV